MKFSRLFVAALFATAGACLPGTAMAQTQTLDFEGMGCDQAVTSGYGGFDWTNFATTSTTCRPDAAYGVVSGTNAAYNGSGRLSMTSGGVFNLNSAWFSSWAVGTLEQATLYEPFSLTVTGYRNGILLFDQVLNLTRDATLYTFNWEGIDQLGFSPGTSQNAWFLADDVTTTVTPEPISMVLLGSGLFGVAGAARRRRRGEELEEA